MAVGPLIRGIFGPYERQISEAYRAIYIDIDALVEQILKWMPSATRILEVGCGEGAVTQRLRAAYTGADITAIDITPRIGRLYNGSPDGVRFVRCTAQDIAASEPGRFDLAVLGDVLHHVPVEMRQGMIDAVRKARLFISEEERNSYANASR